MAQPREALTSSALIAPAGALEAIAGLEVASAGSIAARALDHRFDTKFMVASEDVEALFTSMAPTHAVLMAADQRFDTYQTLYFDSPSRAFFRAHQRGARPRLKVRIRNYFLRQISYLEIKRKTPAGRTEKVRFRRDSMRLSLSEDEQVFLSNDVGYPQLSPALYVEFQRVMLIANQHDERVSFDFGLRYFRTQDAQGAQPIGGFSPYRSASSPALTAAPIAADAPSEDPIFHQRAASSDMIRRLEDLVIVELKQPRPRLRAKSWLALRERHYRPVSLSKYRTGLALSEPDARGAAREIKDFHRWLTQLEQRSAA